jgi:hypothetical protein
VQRIKASNLNRGLVGAWCPSVAGNGLLLPDLSGYGNHGTLTNMDAADWVGTDRGRALDFDGVDDRVSVATPVPSTALTCTGWVLPRVNNQNQGIIGRWVSSADGILFRFGALGVISGRLSINGIETGGGSNTGWTYSANEWAFVALRWTGTNMAVWKNGIEGDVFTAIGTITATPGLFIGGGGASQGAANALIPEIRIYNRALSPSEIKQLYEGGPGYGLRQERKRSRFQVQGFNAGRFRRQQLIGSGVY